MIVDDGVVGFGADDGDVDIAGGDDRDDCVVSLMLMMEMLMLHVVMVEMLLV